MTDYPRPSLTADCVIFDGSKVLLIKRAHEPFAGRWALPGGFVNLGETVSEAASRELFEETGLRIDVGPLHRQLRLVDVFSHPNRDPRGWVVSAAFVADVSDSTDIRVRAGDDAAEYKWCELERIGPEDLAFDHFQILEKAAIKARRGRLVVKSMRD